MGRFFPQAMQPLDVHRFCAGATDQSMNSHEFCGSHSADAAKKASPVVASKARL
jgi:hypothetical protein